MLRMWRDFWAAFWRGYEAKRHRPERNPTLFTWFTSAPKTPFYHEVPMNLGGVTAPVVRVKFGHREAIKHICEPGCQCSVARAMRLMFKVNKGTFN